MKKLVIFSGAGISAESGLSTFRDNGGLWEHYPIEEVATHAAWVKDPKRVTDFYNMRRKNCIEAEPNDAHHKIALLESKFNVTIITQNIDDLHERAGSKNIIHLHGEIMKSRSCVTNKIFPINGTEIHEKDLCPEGYPLRPHVVWFGENVPNMPVAINILNEADILVIIGTSLQVYPAASLIHETKPKCLRFIIDPNDITVPGDVIHIKKTGSVGIKDFFELIK
jgi:NAD-dependent deacetylase